MQTITPGKPTSPALTDCRVPTFFSNINAIYIMQRKHIIYDTLTGCDRT